MLPDTRTAKPLHCKGWQQEGIYRLLLNALAPDVAENRYEYVVYGNGKAVRNEQTLAQLLSALAALEDDETLLVQSGKLVGAFPTHVQAPRVVMSTAMLVSKWANWDTLRALEEKGLTMYGQSTASAWAFIGIQGILQGTFETLWHIARDHFGGSLLGRFVLTSGLGGMGSAQPLAIEMTQGVGLIVEADRDKVMRRLDMNYVHLATDNLQEALRLVRQAIEAKETRTIAFIGNAVDVYEQLLRDGVTPDIVTDQTSAHDLLEGYIPAGLTLAEARHLRVENPQAYMDQARKSVVRHVQAMAAFADRGAVVFEYGNHLRGQALGAGFAEAMRIPSFIALFARDHFCRGTGPLRWIALSGDPEDIFTIDRHLLDAFPGDEHLHSWITFAQNRVHFQGLPARSAWLTLEQRAALLNLLPELVRRGELSAPIAITRDHLDGATMASPHRETENMRDGSDAIADWPVLNALLMASSGATLVSLQQGGGVGVGYSMHAGMTMIVDGTSENADRARKVILGETRLGIQRYADAGYEAAQERLMDLPSLVGGTPRE